MTITLSQIRQGSASTVPLPISQGGTSATTASAALVALGAQPSGNYATGGGTATGINTGDESSASIKTKLGVTTLSGSNTGDETGTSIRTKLGVTTLSGSNTGDQDLSGKQNVLVSGASIRTINGTSLMGAGDVATVQLGATAGSALAASGANGSSTTAAKSDHVHPFPTADNVGAVAINGAITAGTAAKITYDAKGLVTAGTTLAATDIPNLDTAKITTGTLGVARGGTGVATLTGLVKGNGTGAMTAAVVGTDYQAPLVSGTSIKTVGGVSLLGSGDISTGGINTGDIAFSTKNLVNSGYLLTDGKKYLKSAYSALSTAIGRLSLLDFYTRTALTSYSYEILFGNGYYILPQYNGNTCSKWIEGAASCTQGNLPSVALWSAGGFGNNTFVLGAQYTNKAATSTDGISWVARTLPSSVDWRKAVYGNGTFVFIAADTSYATSTDNGATWVARTFPAVANGIVFDGTKFVVLLGRSVRTSTDGITWTTVSDVHFMGAFTGFAFISGVYVASNSSGYVRVSTDNCASWTTVNLPASSSENVVSPVLSNTTMFVCVGGGSYLYYSFNGINWSASSTSLGGSSIASAIGDNTFITHTMNTSTITVGDLYTGLQTTEFLVPKISNTGGMAAWIKT